MSRRGRLIGLAIAIALLANGVANYAHAGFAHLKAVKACEPVKQVPACQPVKPLPLPEVCKPVKPLPLPAACKPVKPLPLPGACKPVKACEQVDAPSTREVVRDHVARLVWRLKRHTTGYAEYESTPQPTRSPAPPTPAPAPQSPTT